MVSKTKTTILGKAGPHWGTPYKWKRKGKGIGKRGRREAGGRQEGQGSTVGTAAFVAARIAHNRQPEFVLANMHMQGIGRRPPGRIRAGQFRIPGGERERQEEKKKEEARRIAMVTQSHKEEGKRISSLDMEEMDGGIEEGQWEQEEQEMWLEEGYN